MELRDLGAALRERRKQLGMSQAQVADYLGWHQTDVSALELGKSVYVPMDKLVRWGAVLGFTPNDIARAAGWWNPGDAPDDDPYWSLLGEIVATIPEERRTALLRQLVALARSERLSNAAPLDGKARRRKQRVS